MRNSYICSKAVNVTHAVFMKRVIAIHKELLPETMITKRKASVTPNGKAIAMVDMTDTTALLAMTAYDDALRLTVINKLLDLQPELLDELLSSVIIQKKEMVARWCDVLTYPEPVHKTPTVMRDVLQWCNMQYLCMTFKVRRKVMITMLREANLMRKYDLMPSMLGKRYSKPDGAYVLWHLESVKAILSDVRMHKGLKHLADKQYLADNQSFGKLH